MAFVVYAEADMIGQVGVQHNLLQPVSLAAEKQVQPPAQKLGVSTSSFDVYKHITERTKPQL